MRSSLKGALVVPVVALGLGVLAAGCSLSNVSRTDCQKDSECASAFGPGSTCEQGFCTEPARCTTGHDCRRLIGGGACVEGACVTTIPENAQCDLATAPPEPPDLLSQKLTGPDAPLVIGSIFSLAAAHDEALAASVRLAVQEINAAGGQKVGVVFCDNGGPDNKASGAARTTLNQQAIDYLAGTLGVPYIVGPLTSGDSVQLIGDLLDAELPTALISPSATSPALTDAKKRLHKDDPYPLFWRTCPSDVLQGQILSEAVVKADTTVKSVTVIHIDDPYGTGFAHVFQSAYGPTATHLVPYGETAPDDPAALAAVVQKAATYDDDAILIIAVHGSVAIQILSAMEGTGLDLKKFFFTDGVKDTDLIDPSNPPWIKTILASARGTAPANPAAANPNFINFTTNLQDKLHVDANSFSFLAHAYDATYVGAFGVVYAMQKGKDWNGLDVTEGMAHLSAGKQVDLSGLDGWIQGSGLIVSDAQIDIEGVSGHLDFDAKAGEAPGRIEIWGINNGAYETLDVIPPN